MQKKRPAALGAAFSHARKVEAKTGGGQKKQHAVAARYLKRKGMPAMAKAGGEGSRGGRIIGHTPAGHPIYEKGNHLIHVDSGQERRSRGKNSEGNQQHISPSENAGSDSIEAHHKDRTLCGQRFKTIEGINPLGFSENHADVSCKKCAEKHRKMRDSHLGKGAGVEASKIFAKAMPGTLGAYQAAIAQSAAPGHLSDDDKYAMSRYQALFDRNHAALAQVRAEALARLLAQRSR